MTVKLYSTPGAPPLPAHLALREAGLSFERERVVRQDGQDGASTGGRDYWSINPEGYIPAVLLDDSPRAASRTATVQDVADPNPRAVPRRARTLKRLRFIATELQKALASSGNTTTEPLEEGILGRRPTSAFKSRA